MTSPAFKVVATLQDLQKEVLAQLLASQENHDPKMLIDGLSLLPERKSPWTQAGAERVLFGSLKHATENWVATVKNEWNHVKGLQYLQTYQDEIQTWFLSMYVRGRKTQPRLVRPRFWESTVTYHEHYQLQRAAKLPQYVLNIWQADFKMPLMASLLVHPATDCPYVQYDPKSTAMVFHMSTPEDMEAGAMFLIQRKYARYLPQSLCHLLISFLHPKGFRSRQEGVAHFVSYERWSRL